MKKFFLVLALAASLQIADAQTNKAVEAAKKQVEAAKAATKDAKKAANMATWIKLGKAYTDAYTAAQGNAFVGTSAAELPILMNGVKPIGEEVAVVANQEMLVQHYETADYYIADGKVSMIVITKPAFDDALSQAVEAYKKAHELDVKGKKTKDISDGIRIAVENYDRDAISAFQLKDFARSSELFGAAVAASEVEPYAQLDTNSIYNAGLTATMAGNNARAKEYFNKCRSISYYGEEGDVYARLAAFEEQEGNKEASLKLLEEGFVAFPKSQSILIGLINAYNTEGGNTDRLFELLSVARQNEPNNASLWYVEGDIRLKMTPPQVEEAFAAYDKCIEIDPNYEYGYIGKGVYLYNRAAEISEQASNEYDDAKYAVLEAEFHKALKGCIEPFEKAYEISKDESLKLSVAEYIKSACFRFREDPEYLAKYEKYNAIVTNGK